MTRAGRRRAAPACLLALACAALGTACSSPGPGPRVTPAPAPSFSDLPSTRPTRGERPDLGPAPADLHDADWDHARVPGDFCHIAGSVGLDADSYDVTGESSLWGTVHVNRTPQEVVYGDVTGDGRDEAALRVGCDNGGGTAAGDIAFGAVVLTSDRGRLRALGTVTPQYEPDSGPHAALIGDLTLARGKVTAEEDWYRTSDATCCPTGVAVTVWSLSAGGTLTAGPPRVTS
ncbi:hypothetical protein [Streptomyces sp. NPDC003717]|uniref:hypothetical protein n=1 Tax=Streptomyces sp. NPDC003717 TaxID=3154276 RepID=UPI0033B48639